MNVENHNRERGYAMTIGFMVHMLNSTQPYTPNIVSVGDELELWYTILPDDFGENYDVVFENQEEKIFFIEGDMIQQEKISLSEELAIEPIYLDTAEIA